jgi:hypothetical protein
VKSNRILFWPTRGYAEIDPLKEEAGKHGIPLSLVFGLSDFTREMRDDDFLLLSPYLFVNKHRGLLRLFDTFSNRQFHVYDTVEARVIYPKEFFAQRNVKNLVEFNYSPVDAVAEATGQKTYAELVKDFYNGFYKVSGNKLIEEQLRA